MRKKTCVIVTCISTFTKITFREYESDIGEEKISAILTNEAGTQYLFRKIIQDDDRKEDEINIVLVLLESDEVKKTEMFKKVNGEVERKSKNKELLEFKQKADEKANEKLAFVSEEEQINEVEYFKKRMEYEWKLLKHDNNMNLDSEVIHIKMDGDNREKCESIFMNHIFKLREKCDKLEIYMDETGGPRDINYTFALLIRMLEYSNIKCKDIVYSNINNETNKINSILPKHQYVDIVTGMDEFVRYGKTEMLREQFDGLGISQADEAITLLNAMQGYSEQLTLCNVDGFEHANDALKDAIDDFSAKRSEDYILNLLLDNLKQKIALDNNRDRLPFLLKRCHDNDMIQQGITIYNELVPSYLITTLKVLQIKNIAKRDNYRNSKKRMETLLHGMEIPDCWKTAGIKDKDVVLGSHFGVDVENIVKQNYTTKVNLEWFNGYQKLFTTLINDEKMKFGKYTSAYYVLHNLDKLSNQIVFPKGNRQKVIEVIKDYLELRELRNKINHASGIEEMQNNNESKEQERDYIKNHFRLPALKSDTLTYDNVKESLKQAIKNLEGLNYERRK